MTSYYPFQPSGVNAPSFQPTFDGAVYNCAVTWNLFGQRYYVNCFDQNGVRVFTVALVGSPAQKLISTLSWSSASLTATAETALPHGFKVGTVVRLTIAGASPAAYNGEYLAFITTPMEFEFPLANDPGPVIMAGSNVGTD